MGKCSALISLILTNRKSWLNIEKQLQKTKSKGVHETRASTKNLIQKVLFSIKNV